MKLKLLYTAIAILTANLATAQVLYTENFDNLTIGDLSTDPTGNTPGQGGWYLNLTNSSGQAKLIPETNRGNVLAIGLSSFLTDNVKVIQKGLDVLWNNRTPGNDILHFEYDYYLVQTVDRSILSYTVLWSDKKNLFRAFSWLSYFPSQNKNEHVFEASYWTASGKQSFPLGSNGSNVYTNFQYDTWISVQVFMDYTTGKIYLYIPALQILSSGTFSHNEILKRIELYANMSPYNPQISAKYDNIRISAIKTLPPYLGIDDFISSKFNVFPNPVNDMVTITNNEGIDIEEIIVYDITGKRIKTKKYNDENEIQLNLSALSSGTYLLHLKTKDGIAIKKVIKK